MGSLTFPLKIKTPKLIFLAETKNRNLKKSVLREKIFSENPTFHKKDFIEQI